MSFIDSRMVHGPDGKNINDKLAEQTTQLADIASQVGNGGGGNANIDDTSATGDKVWSSLKTQQQIQLIPKGDKGDKGDPGVASVAIDDSVTNGTQTWSSNKISSFASTPADNTVSSAKLTKELKSDTITSHPNFTAKETTFYLPIVFDVGDTNGETFTINYTAFSNNTLGRLGLRVYANNNGSPQTYTGGYVNTSLPTGNLYTTGTKQKATYTTPAVTAGYKYLYVMIMITSTVVNNVYDIDFTNIEVARSGTGAITPIKAGFLSTNATGTFENPSSGFIIGRDRLLVGKDKTEILEKFVDKNIYLIGHFGQSNADGRATGTKPLSINNNVYMIKRPTGSTAVITQGNAFDDDVSSAGWFAQGLNHLTGKNIALAKYAVGGTRLVPIDTASWNPATTSATKYYASALLTYQVARDALIAQGFNVIQLGFTWTQGETDGDDSRTKAEYKQALIDLITAFRTDLGVSDFKCFINELGMYNSGAFDDTKYSQIRTAQNEVANEVANVFMISDIAKKYIPPKMNYMQDTWHYTKDGYVLMGKMSAEYVYKSIFNPMYNPQYKKAADKALIDSMYA